MFHCLFFFFFFKQKTAYEMRISDWSSDVCSSDLVRFPSLDEAGELFLRSPELEKVADHRMIDAIENGLTDAFLAAFGFLNRLDLQVHEQQVAELVGAAPVDLACLLVYLRRLLAPALEVAQCCGELLAQVVLRVVPLVEDRKSVVWGKSVSVRV